MKTKKILPLILAACLVLLSLSACSGGGSASLVESYYNKTGGSTSCTLNLYSDGTYTAHGNFVATDEETGSLYMRTGVILRGTYSVKSEDAGDYGLDQGKVVTLEPTTDVFFSAANFVYGKLNADMEDGLGKWSTNAALLETFGLHASTDVVLDTTQYAMMEPIETLSDTNLMGVFSWDAG